MQKLFPTPTEVLEAIATSLAFALTALTLLARALCAQTGAEHTRLRIGLIIPTVAGASSAASVARGVRLGAGEAKQTGALFGDDVELYELSAAGAAASTASEKLLRARKIQVLIASSPSDVDALSRFAELHHIIFLNAASRSQSLRDACRRYTFHVEATDAMYANARNAGRDSVVLWGPSLQRFGASQVNDRYRDKFHLDMDGPAWAGWAAVKIAGEAALRARSSAPSKLLAYLESAETQFDGHKGWPLTFRSADHQLREPLYLVVRSGSGPGQQLRDVPELRASPTADVEQSAGIRATDHALDALIRSANARKCAWGNR